MDRYFSLGAVAGTTLTRWAVLDHGVVVGVQVSRPEGIEVERSTHLRWRRQEVQDVQVKRYRINETPMSHNGEQARRPTWRRAGRTVAMEIA